MCACVLRYLACCTLHVIIVLLLLLRIAGEILRYSSHLNYVMSYIYAGLHIEMLRLSWEEKCPLYQMDYCMDDV